MDDKSKIKVLRNAIEQVLAVMPDMRGTNVLQSALNQTTSVPAGWHVLELAGGGCHVVPDNPTVNGRATPLRAEAARERWREAVVALMDAYSKAYEKHAATETLLARSGNMLIDPAPKLNEAAVSRARRAALEEVLG